MAIEVEDFIAEYDPSEIFGRSSSGQPVVIFSWLVLVIFVVLVARLADLQIVKGAKNFFLAEGNRVREIKKQAPRGIIVDRNNEPLVKNVVHYSLALIPADIPRAHDDQARFIDRLAAVAGLPQEDARSAVESNRGGSFEPVVVKDNLSKEDALRYEIELNDLPATFVQKIPTRQYLNPSLAHVLGSIGKISKDELQKGQDYTITDWVGKSGIELAYEDHLRGRDGGTHVEVNAKGNIVRLIGEVKPERGQDLTLTIDAKLQQAGMKAMEGIAKKGGAFVALNPKTGQVLALGSYPDYDSNIFLSGDATAINQVLSDSKQPLINRAIAAAFPSGSIIKPLWATAALSEGTITENTKLDTSAGAIRIGDFEFNDWKVHGVTDVRQAIAESNNIFFFSVAGGYDKIKGLGPDKLASWAQKFGLGQKTGIDLPSETHGFVPTPEWKKKKTGQRWFVGDSYNLGIGQGNLLVSPLQMARAIGAIATGKLATPQLLQGEKAQLKNMDAPEHSLQVVREGMRLAVTAGSARQLQDLKRNDGSPVEAAGKTGTAQIGSDLSKTHGWMEAYAPYNDPEIVVVAFVEEGGEGHATAGPIIKAMLQEWFGR